MYYLFNFNWYPYLPAAKSIVGYLLAEQHSTNKEFACHLRYPSVGQPDEDDVTLAPQSYEQDSAKAQADGRSYVKDGGFSCFNIVVTNTVSQVNPACFLVLRIAKVRYGTSLRPNFPVFIPLRVF